MKASPVVGGVVLVVQVETEVGAVLVAPWSFLSMSKVIMYLSPEISWTLASLFPKVN